MLAAIVCHGAIVFVLLRFAPEQATAPAQRQRLQLIELVARRPIAAPEPARAEPSPPPTRAAIQLPTARAVAPIPEPEVVTITSAAELESPSPAEPALPSETPTLFAPGPRRQSADSYMDRVLRGTGPSLTPDLDQLNRALAAEHGATTGQELASALRPEQNARADEEPGPQLLPREGGGYRYLDSRFEAEILPDGSVVFKDRPPNPKILGIGLADLVQGKYDLSRLTVDDAKRAVEKALVDAAATKRTAEVASINFDVTDVVMRLAGEDPYASVKQCFLDDVAEVREEMADQHHLELEKQTRSQIEAELCRIWGDELRPAPVRRAALFELWDESGDDVYGRLAQRLIVAFIRERLPRGSAIEFGKRELERLNSRRTHKLWFAPYQLGTPDAGVPDAT